MRVGTVRTESWVRREGFETPGGVCLIFTVNASTCDTCTRIGKWQ